MLLTDLGFGFLIAVCIAKINHKATVFVSSVIVRSQLFTASQRVALVHHVQISPATLTLLGVTITNGLLKGVLISIASAALPLAVRALIGG